MSAAALLGGGGGGGGCGRRPANVATHNSLPPIIGSRGTPAASLGGPAATPLSERRASRPTPTLAHFAPPLPFIPSRLSRANAARGCAPGRDPGAAAVRVLTPAGRRAAVFSDFPHVPDPADPAGPAPLDPTRPGWPAVQVAMERILSVAELAAAGPRARLAPRARAVSRTMTGPPAAAGAMRGASPTSFGFWARRRSAPLQSRAPRAQLLPPPHQRVPRQPRRQKHQARRASVERRRRGGRAFDYG